MATFLAKVQGSRGAAHRLGHSIISAEVNGWNLGVQVIGRRDEDGRVSFEVWKTGGTRGGGKLEKIADVADDRKPPKKRKQGALDRHLEKSDVPQT